MNQFYIIDALGAFTERSKQENINWSKVSFQDIEDEGRINFTASERIVSRFEKFILKSKALGYNSVSIDDVAHMVILPCYSASTAELLKDYSALYTQLFSIAKRHDVSVFINTDYLFFNDDIRRYITTNHIDASDFFLEVLTLLFETTPDISGVILRIGENDGIDVSGTFLSSLVIKNPKKINDLLNKVLPLFEANNKKLIFRTWTVGVYEVGDLIWNKRTLSTAFKNITSNALIVSMKYGDTDFMRYLKLNPCLLEGSYSKIIELQTRREWEGMGTYPSFVGWDYAEYFKLLRDRPDIAGLHVWCQTGGWAKQQWSNVTMLENSSFWNELNTFVTIKIYKDNTMSPEGAIRSFCENHGIKDSDQFIRLLALSEIVIKNGLYFKEIAEKSYYFRRSRLPTLTWIMWDRLLDPSLSSILIRALITKPEHAIQEAIEAKDAANEMVAIAKNIELPRQLIDSLSLQAETFSLFVDIRKYLLGRTDSASLKNLQVRANKYMSLYPNGYSIPALMPLGNSWSTRLLGEIFRAFIRDTKAYRVRDRIILLTSPIQKQIVRYYIRRSGHGLKDQSMGIDVLFK